MNKRRLTIDMFPGGLDDRVLRTGDIVDEKIVCATIGTYESELERHCIGARYGAVVAQNREAYTKKYIGGIKLLHTFMKGSPQFEGNWVYKGMCKEGGTENLDPFHGRKVFVVSRYAGDIKKNVRFALEVCARIIHDGDVPIAPHLYFPQFLDDGDEMEREIGIEAGHVLMESCDVVLVATRKGDCFSPGMEADIEYAAKIGLPIEYEES